MKTKHKNLFAMLLVVILVQLSCDITEFYDNRSERDKDIDKCEEKGGIWHYTPYGYCEMPAATNTPTPILQAAVEAPQSNTNGIPFDILQCDAGVVVNVAPTLNEDRMAPGSRSCFYTQITTNNSDQNVMFYYHNVRSTQDPSWVSVLLAPWETHTFIGYLSDTDYGGLTYSYIDKVAAIYYVDACNEATDPFDTTAAAELFDFEPLSYCNP